MMLKRKTPSSDTSGGEPPNKRGRRDKRILLLADGEEVEEEFDERGQGMLSLACAEPLDDPEDNSGDDEEPSDSLKAQEMLQDATEAAKAAEDKHAVAVQQFRQEFERVSKELKIAPQELALKLAQVSSIRGQRRQARIGKECRIDKRTMAQLIPLSRLTKTIGSAAFVWLSKLEQVDAAKVAAF